VGSLGFWSIIAVLSSLTSLTSGLSSAEADVSTATEAGALEPTAMSIEPAAMSIASTRMSFERERSQLGPARLFAASLDTFEMLSVASTKLQLRSIRISIDSDEMEGAPFTREPRPFRRALDDAELAAPPDPPRYLRLTLDD
jgi:hypothetical protein